ncbi:hypothetical protein LVY72_22685 [Arthrobacter sp. I2-34]|uniref:Phage FDXHR zinc binding domain-containing protein n=1 Tax=Arthrobacter hankyongi TaxID=2904801 RepID=A0ABS9LDE7_9MICC|nr:hypothetical protein [Arthrobacter hankyongi]MCG2624700.1 hypothetical protein [Arthrobacter hankyongi]
MSRTMSTDAPRTVTHPACGASWPNHNTNSHCTQCHQTFGNHKIADRHRIDGPAGRRCLDPAQMKVNGHVPVMIDGIWVSGARFTAATTIFRQTA